MGCGASREESARVRGALARCRDDEDLLAKGTAPRVLALATKFTRSCAPGRKCRFGAWVKRRPWVLSVTLRWVVQALQNASAAA